MELLGLLLPIGIVVIIGAIAHKYPSPPPAINKQDLSERLQAWIHIARKMGGHWHETKQYSKQVRAIEVGVDEALIIADAYHVGNRTPHFVHSRLRAKLLVPGKPRFDISSKPMPTTTAKINYLPITAMGDSDLDELFVVRTSDLELTQDLWTLRARKLLLTSFRDAQVSCNAGEVKLHVPRMLRGDELKRALELVGELVNVNIFGLTELVDLPGAQYIAPTGPWDERSLPHVEVDGPALVTLGPVPTASGYAATQADVGEVWFPNDLELEVDEDGECDRDTEDLPDGAALALRQVGSGLLRVRRGRASFFWDEIEVDMGRLQAGIRLLNTFCMAPQQGIYR